MQSIIDISYSILAFFIVVSVIAFIHEFGHYLAARLCGVRIEAFSIGFGAEICGWNDSHGTRWKICYIPLGGYVRMFGDSNAASAPDREKLAKLTSEDKKIAFHTKPLWAKAIIVIAGPLANFLLAVIIFAFMFHIYGRPFASPMVEKVVPGSRAAQAELMPGDMIVNIDGESIKNFFDIEQIVSVHPEMPLHFVIKRKGKLIIKDIKPESYEEKDKSGNVIKIGRIGIMAPKVEFLKYSLGAAFIEATKESWQLSALIVNTVGQMIKGQRSASELGGPIRIAKYSKESMEHGWRSLLWFMALLSINLWVVNLLPIPVLDGGHLLYYAIEAVSGRPLAEKVQEYCFRFGIVLIVMLVIFSTVNDIRHIYHN